MNILFMYNTSDDNITKLNKVDFMYLCRFNL